MNVNCEKQQSCVNSSSRPLLSQNSHEQTLPLEPTSPQFTTTKTKTTTSTTSTNSQSIENKETKKEGRETTKPAATTTTTTTLEEVSALATTAPVKLRKKSRLMTYEPYDFSGELTDSDDENVRCDSEYSWADSSNVQYWATKEKN